MITVEVKCRLRGSEVNCNYIVHFKTKIAAIVIQFSCIILRNCSNALLDPLKTSRQIEIDLKCSVKRM